MHPMIAGCRANTITAISLILFTCLLLAACGGGGGGISLNAVTTGSTAGAAADSEATTIAEIMALETPEGVDEATFAMLKTTLVAMVETLSTSHGTSAVPPGDRAYVGDLECFSFQDGIDIFHLNRWRTYDSGDWLMWGYVNPGDYNQDSEVSAADLTPVGRYYGATSADSDWFLASSADGNGDGAITVADLTPIGQNYGQRIQNYRIYRSADYHDHPAYNDGEPGPGAELLDLWGTRYDSEKYGVQFECQASETVTDYFYWVVPVDNEEEGIASRLSGGGYNSWPAVTGLEPANGLPGTEVVISGARFGDSQDDSTIQLAGMDLAVQEWSDGRIRAVIPEGATDGVVRITVDGLFVDAGTFILAETPSITGVAPVTLEFGSPFAVDGSGFEDTHGAGVLLIDDRAHPVASWTDTRLDVANLDAMPGHGATARIQVINNRGLVSNVVEVDGDFADARVTVDQLMGAPIGYSACTPTVFTFTVELDSNLPYEYVLVPNIDYLDETVEDQDPDTPGIQYTYTYEYHGSRNPTAVIARNPATGHSFLIYGPTLLVLHNDNYPLNLAVNAVDFNNGEIQGPNDACYLPDGRYHDITFIDGHPYITSALSDLTDGAGEARTGYTRDLQSYLRDGDNPRPVCYRLAYDWQTAESSSITAVSTANMDDAEAVVLNSTGVEPVQITEFVPWDGNSGWTADETRFKLSDDNHYQNCSGELFVGNTWYDSPSWTRVPLICSPLVITTLPTSRVSPAGEMSLTGQDLMPVAVDGQSGPDAYAVWFIPVSYQSPWTGETVQAREMLTRLLKASQADTNYLRFDLTELDPDGDGLVEVEVFNDDYSESVILEATLRYGESSYFLWTGVLDTGGERMIADSGIFSELYEVYLDEDKEFPAVLDAMLDVDTMEWEVPLDLTFRASNAGALYGLVDFEWDLDGDGLFNEPLSLGANGREALARGHWSWEEPFHSVGSHTVSVRITDMHGNTAVASQTFELVDELGYLQLFMVVNGDPPPESLTVTAQVYDGDPVAGGELLDSYDVDFHIYPLWASHGVLFQDLPHGDYWVRLVNPEVWWGEDPVPGDSGIPGYYDLGPLAVPQDSVYEISGEFVE